MPKVPKIIELQLIVYIIEQNYINQGNDMNIYRYREVQT